MLNHNRFGQLPKAEHIGIDFSEWPLHLKDVPTLDQRKLATLPLANSSLLPQWQGVSKWLTGNHGEIPIGQALEARINDAELNRMLAIGHVEGTTHDDVKGTCHLFPVPEPAKQRRRLIKHTKSLN
eukprot:PhM_4_TR3017/c2_g6_i1/m.89384